MKQALRPQNYFLPPETAEKRGNSLQVNSPGAYVGGGAGIYFWPSSKESFLYSNENQAVVGKLMRKEEKGK